MSTAGYLPPAGDWRVCSSDHWRENFAGVAMSTDETEVCSVPKFTACVARNGRYVMDMPEDSCICTKLCSYIDFGSVYRLQASFRAPCSMIVLRCK